jgi:hypothetical protein
MNRTEKQQLVDELSEKIKGAQALYFTDFTGLNVKRMTDLRRRLRKAGVEYVVIKNTLALRAVNESGLVAGSLKGPTGIVVAADALAAHRADRARLAAALARPGPSPRVVVTHHAPLTRILEPYRGRPGVPWWIPAFYGSTLLEDLPPAHRPEVWISGHFHAAHDLVDGGTRCVANPAAAADFDPGLTIEVEAAPSPLSFRGRAAEPGTPNR